MSSNNPVQQLFSEFLKSSSRPSECPPSNLPEYAFIGRSNVGKSSLINFLMQRKELAMTSGKPGKTKLINHFLVNKKWYLVDLPGYGYAQTSKKDRQKYDQMIRTYLMRRENLVNSFILIDARIPPQKIDLEFINWMGVSSIPFELVFTKADKSKKTNVSDNIQAFLDMLGNDWDELPPHHITSAQAKEGRDDFLKRIFELNEQFSGIIADRYKSKT
ncbi:MAG: YihA family ribosome biogenesis GTP-binding protein [Bacteroidia bacterium]